MPTRESLDWLIFFCTFFFIGVLLQNVALLLMSLVPLSFLVLGLGIDQPSEISMRRPESSGRALVNDFLEFRVDVTVKGGIGIVTMADELPNEFELMDGNNFVVLWKGDGEKRLTFTYRVKCCKRGTYRIKFSSESRHPLGFKQTIRLGGDELEVTVRPRLLDMRRMRGPATSTRLPLPAGALARIGSPTMDFRELRHYVWGDPFKFINWKATAKSASRGNPIPIVNEYEREGKKLVWIFLDCSPAMLLGPSFSNTFEHAVEALHSLAHYYLSRGCMVGLCTFGGNAVTLLHPDVGNRQYRKISELLLKLEPSKDLSMGLTDLTSAVEECRRYLMGREPLCIILSRFTGRTSHSLEEGIKELSKYCAPSRRSFIMLVNILGYGLVAKDAHEKVAAHILTARDGILSRGLGAPVLRVNWDPSAESFTSAILRQVVRWRIPAGH